MNDLHPYYKFQEWTNERLPDFLIILTELCLIVGGICVIVEQFRNLIKAI